MWQKLVINLLFCSSMALAHAQCGPCAQNKQNAMHFLYSAAHSSHRSLLMTYRPMRVPVKLTVKTKGSVSVLDSARLDALETFDLSEAFDGLGLMNFVNFDVRLKIYINKQLQVKFRCLVLPNTGNIYTAGIIIKPYYHERYKSR